MKICFLFVGVLFTLSSFAQSDPKTHIIAIDGCSFNPSTINASVGDTIIWSWQAAATRTTSSISVPSGAAYWDATVNENNRTFTYVLTTPGDYYYKSNILPTCIASITVVSAVGINELSQQNKTKAFPNPVKDKLIVIYPYGAQKLSLFTETGSLVKEVSLDKGQTNVTVDITDLAYGIYIYSVYSDKGIIDSKRIIRIP